MLGLSNGGVLLVRACSFCFVVGSALVLGVAPVRAAPQHKLVMFPLVPVEGEVSPRIVQEMANAIAEEITLASASSLLVVPTSFPAPGSAVAPQENSTGSPARLNLALRKVADGLRYARQLKPEATETLEAAHAALLDNIRFVSAAQYNELLAVYLALSEAYFRRGKQQQGTEALEAIVRLQPEYQLNAQKYPPMFLQVFNDVKQRLLQQTPGTIHITSAPLDADVWVNGTHVGKTPLRVQGVVPGENFVNVRQGTTLFGLRVEVPKGRMAEVHAPLRNSFHKGIGDELGRNRFSRATRSALRKAGSAHGDFALVLTMGKGDGLFAVGGFLGQLRTNKWVSLVPISPDMDMLSSSIEANTLALDILKHIKNFNADVGKETLPMIAGRGIDQRSASPKQTPKEVTVQFTRPTAHARRAPALATTDADAELNIDDLLNDQDAAETTVANTMVASTRPASRRSVPNTNRTDMDSDLELELEIIPVENANTIGGAKASRSRVRVDSSPKSTTITGDGDLALLSRPTDNDLNLRLQESPPAITDRAWFWPTVIGSVVAAAAVTTAIILLNRQPRSVRVYAVW